MPKGSDKEIALARVYSSAMLGLAESRGEAEALLVELDDLATYLDKKPNFDSFFSSPMIDPTARERTIEKLFRGKLGDLLVDSLQVLNRKGRLALFRGIAETYRVVLEERRGIMEVQVKTAVPLADSLREKLQRVASQHAGRRARLVETVDESIIGGMILRIGDRKIDTSVASRLRNLAQSLGERASREIHGGRSFVTKETG